MIRRPPRSPLFPYTTLSQSSVGIVSLAPRNIPAIRNRLGIQLEDPDTAKITGIIPDSPAQFAGLRTSDLITAINQKPVTTRDRKSTRLNSSHSQLSYAVFCL